VDDKAALLLDDPPHAGQARRGGQHVVDVRLARSGGVKETHLGTRFRRLARYWHLDESGETGFLLQMPARYVMNRTPKPCQNALDQPKNPVSWRLSKRKSVAGG
jgi:hypothetical protein